MDDQAWSVRYLIADAGNWLTSRLVLIPPAALGEPDWESQRLKVDITREQVKNSPPIDTRQPISRQQQIEYHRYFNWPMYGTATWGLGTYGRVMVDPAALPPTRTTTAKREAPPAREESSERLRSLAELIGYQIRAVDGTIGHVEDFVVDDETWQIRYLVIDTGNWLPGRKVLISAEWIDWVSWGDQEVRVGMTQEQIKESPDFDPGTPVNREYEIRLYDYYGRPKYWQ